MKITLVDVDSKIPNLALMKLSTYYKNRDDNVSLVQLLLSRRKKIYPEIELKTDCDYAHISYLYERNEENIKFLKNQYENFEIGGATNLVLPKEIELLKPDYDIYPSEYSQGYTTRGCIRNCPWCVVREKEGQYRQHQHVKDFYDNRFDTIMIMDNNWLADKDWFFKNTDFILENNLKVIEHGMDVRLLDKEVVQRLSELKFAKPMKFAFDQLNNEEDVLKGIELLKNAGINTRQNVQFYILVGYNTTFDEDIYRCNLLKSLKTNAYVMPYNRVGDIKHLTRWANAKQLFWSLDFNEYLDGKLRR